eukprot:TRINITY_DN1152_c0_g1_i1.p2 TRINITY_DN1152_c0_g1~~TRINITY_DN1152_c0_g1_i1.p2  ORF type:complete len:142 (-),score=13.25 TRINITY_DN1152_c0_g1_i1:896-1321(-)
MQISFSESVFVSRAESHAGLFYQQVIECYKEYMVQQFPSFDIKVMYVCGTDRSIGSFGWGIWEQEGVIAIERPGCHFQFSLPNVHVLSSPQKEDVSSSLIRKEGLESPLLRNPSVTEYLRKHKLLGKCSCKGRWNGTECTC